MGLKRRTILRTILAATVLALGVILLGLVQINLSFVKDDIEQFVRDSLELDVTFQGSLRLRLGPDPRIEATAIEIHKAGAVDEVLLRVDALSAHLKAVQVAGAQFDYCAALPSLGDDNKSNGPLPSIAADTVMATNLHIFCGDRRNEQTPDVVIGELYGSASASGAMAVAAQGRVNDLPIELEAHSGNLNALLTSPDDFPVRFGIASEGAEFRLEGAIDDPLGQFELRADASLQVEHAKRLLSDLGISIPEIAALEFAGQTWLNFDAAGIENIVGKIGDSDFTANGLARFSAGRNYYELDTRLSRLHPDLFGSAPVVSAENEGWETFDLQSLYDTLSEFDGKVHIAVDELGITDVQVEKLELDASLNDGSLVVSRYRMHFMGSPIEAEARLDMQGACGEFRAHGRVEGIDLKRLAEWVDSKFAIGGNLDRFEFNTHSCGNTFV